jgi:hypothetical protein
VHPPNLQVENPYLNFELAPVELDYLFTPLEIDGPASSP